MHTCINLFNAQPTRLNILLGTQNCALPIFLLIVIIELLNLTEKGQFKDTDN